MNYIFVTCRLLLGSVLFVFGLNGFFNFYPLPETTPEAQRFLDALWNSGYLMYIEKSIEVAVGLCLLSNRFVTAALLVLLPLSLNIALVDTLLQPQYWYYGGSVFVLNVALLVEKRETFRVIKVLISH